MIAFLLSYLLSHALDPVELWSAEHLDDMLIDDAYRKSVSAYYYAVVALYRDGDGCKSRMTRSRLKYMDLPERHVLYATYNGEYVRSLTWFNFSDNMDLNLRHSVDLDEECPQYFFYDKDHSYTKYDSNLDVSVTEWVYDLLKMELKLENSLDEEVNMFLVNVDKAKRKKLVHLGPSEGVKKSVAIGSHLVAKTTNGEFLGRWEIDGSQDLLVIHQQTSFKPLAEYKKELEDALGLQRKRLWSTRRRYLNNVKGPPLVPGFYPNGFSNLRIPDEAYKIMLDAWESRKHKKKSEHFHRDSTQLNINEVPAYIVPLKKPEERRVIELVQPVLEAMSGIELEFSILYGMREYHRGAVVKGHCDVLETHIVSAIFHITHEQEPDEPHWNIEVTGSEDGQRHRIEDQPGDLTYYESAKVIHGRPDPFNGTSWVNAFIHFRPKHDWTYRFTRDNVIITPNAEINLVDNIYG